MADTYLTKTYSTGGNQKTFTFSAWVKRSKLSVAMQIFGQQVSNYFRIMFHTTDCVRVYSPTMDLQSERLFRDTSGWYHIVVAVDTTQAAGTDRCKIYINGDIIPYTSGYSTETYPNQNDDLPVSTAHLHKIGAGNSTDYFDGIMSHIHFCDGTMYNALTFGETDATTGEWKIKTSPSVTYGDNGFFILKDGNSVTDQSGESNNWAVAGTALTNTEDCPSDVFNTCNPLYQRPTNKTMGFLYGNTEVWVGTGASDKACGSTMAVSKGKFYWEQKIIANDGAGTNASLVGGLFATEDFAESPGSYGAANTCGIAQNGNAWKDTTDLGNFTTAPVGGDIFGIAFDADNGTVKFWRAGAALNSGNAIITGLDTSKTWMPYFVAHSGTGNARTINNFGNGYFQTTAITSEGTNASNIGKFEYDVPTGYTALSTKGLNE